MDTRSKEVEMQGIKKREASLIDIDDPENEFKLFKGLDHPISIDEVLVPPNASNVNDIVKIVNEGRDSHAMSSVVGTLIDPGKVGIINYNGKIELVPPGRYLFPNPRASLVQVANLIEDVVKLESLSIVRVQRGKIGLAIESGHPYLLAEGTHVRNNRFFKLVEFKPINQQYLTHGSIHIVRVPQGHYGLVTENGVPKLLPEGVHVTNSNVFTFDNIQIANQPYLRHGTIHILRVPKGNVALVQDNNKPKMLGEGTHYINSNTFNFYKMEDLSTQAIKHGTITRFRVRRGEIGLAWDNNQPAFFDEGVYEKDSPNFTFVKCVDASDKQVTLGSRKIITVWDGEVGVSYLKGKLKVLRPDRHIIESADHVFQGFLSTQQQCLHLLNPESKNKEHLTCETKDFVEIGLKADVFYKIGDPEKVLLVVGKDNIEPLVRETAIATLNSIIRSTSLAEVAQSKEITARSEKVHAQQNRGEGPSAPLFFDKVHDEFISKLHDSFMDQYGIEVTNIRIESFKIMNAELSNNISKQALTTAQTETQLSNLTGQTEIATAQQKRDAEVARIKAEGEAIRLKTETDARNRTIMETAKAEADATVIRAKAEAQAIELRAEAEAKAILLKAEAESKKAELLSSTPLGGQITMFQMYAEMVKSSMQGIEKLVYLPSDAANNPFSFLSLQQGMLPGFGAFKVPPNAAIPSEKKLEENSHFK